METRTTGFSVDDPFERHEVGVVQFIWPCNYNSIFTSEAKSSSNLVLILFIINSIKAEIRSLKGIDEEKIRVRSGNITKTCID